jgi:uncharacterized membrane protein
MPAPPPTNSTSRTERIDEISAFFDGQLPPPETLAEYEKLAPGTAKRIIELAKMRGDVAEMLVKQQRATTITIRIFGAVTVIFLILFSGVSAFIVHKDSYKAAVLSVLPLIATVVSSVVGFYF